MYIIMNIWSAFGYFCVLCLMVAVIIAIFVAVNNQLCAVFLAMLVVLLFSYLIGENQNT